MEVQAKMKTCSGCGQEYRDKWRDEDLVKLSSEQTQQLWGRDTDDDHLCPTCVEDVDLRF